MFKKIFKIRAERELKKTLESGKITEGQLSFLAASREQADIFERLQQVEDSGEYEKIILDLTVAQRADITRRFIRLYENND